MLTKIFVIVFILCLVAVSADAGGLSAARAVAMGGAHMGLARGVYAPLYNPANIGLSEYRENSIELAGAGVHIMNNSFTLADYNEYTGAVLSEDDKSVILGKIPAEGLKISAEAEVGAMSVSLGSMVLSINGVAATEVNLGKDALRLFLEGNDIDEAFSLEGMYSEAIAYGSVGMSYGVPVYVSGTRQLAVGATVKYIRGFAYEEVTELTGEVVTLAAGFSGEGTMIARTAMGGSGYGVDIGAALKLNDSYAAGISVSNFLSNITWNNKTEEHGYHFELDTINLDLIDDDSINVSEDWSNPIENFSSSLPSVMKFGLANIDGRFLWAVDYIQGFRLAAGASSKPRIAAGIEYHLFSFLPIRTGYSLGGGKGSVISGGLGVDLSLFHFDIAVSNNSTLNLDATKGLHLALATGIRF
ncbi:MAG: hypothetical protein CVT49_14910 [candidate division Zixibacteria bacterium HGW-Zixibacteria-1]|nr:MAG: hypothetical protein CVT49_14910 [candidate division Zixibacteria bacterium HGW-Zixibacteria-1]